MRKSQRLAFELSRYLSAQYRVSAKLVNRAHQTAIGAGRLAWADSPLGLEGETAIWPRRYCLGEQPMTLLKALLKALSDS